MNLTFVDIGQSDGCVIQGALVPRDCRAFWIAWRACQNDDLKKRLSLRKESDGWHVYRRIPLDADPAQPSPPMPYVLRHVSRLLPYQARAVAGLTRAVIDRGIGIDGSDTGLGKSYVALAACRELDLRPGIVCKKAGIAGWSRACAYMGVSPLFIVNWEMARTGNFAYCIRVHHQYEPRWLYHWRMPPGTVLVFDEVHVACNDGTLNNQTWQGHRGTTPCINLSATMADRPVRLSTLFSLLGVCSPQAYRQWLVKRGHFTNMHNELESISTVQDMKAIHHMLYPYYGVRLSYQDRDVRASFPDAVYQVELISLDKMEAAHQNAAYAVMRERVAHFRALGRQADVLTAELRFRQAAELLKAPVLADYARDYVAEGRSVCIFVNFRETLAALAKLLNTRSMIFGDQDRYGLDRERVIADFQGNASRIILCMVDAGGQSIDLHDLAGGHQRISLICPTYNPISLRQVLGRTYRARAKTPPVMKLVYAAGTIEEKVAQTVAAKLDSIDALNRGDLMEPDLFNILGDQP